MRRLLPILCFLVSLRLPCAAEDGIRTALVEEARRFIGAPYLAGGSSPKGSDCSGLTSAVYRSVTGLELPRSARGQWLGGRAVGLSEALPGDILCFDTLGGPSHVGLYIGSKNFIHARDYGKPACVSSLDEEYYRSRFLGVRRYLPDRPGLAAVPGQPTASSGQAASHKPTAAPTAKPPHADASPHPAVTRVESLVPFVIPVSASIQRAKIPAVTDTWIEARLDRRVDTTGFSWAVVRGEWKSSRRGRSPVLAEGSLTKDGIPPFLLDKPGTWSLVVFDASGAFRASLVLQARKDSK